MSTLLETRPTPKPTQSPDPWAQPPAYAVPAADLTFGKRVRHVSRPGLWKIVRAAERRDSLSRYHVRVREVADNGSLIGAVLSWRIDEVAAIVTDEPTIKVEMNSSLIVTDEPKAETVKCDVITLDGDPAEANQVDHVNLKTDRPLVVAMVISIDHVHYSVSPLAPSPDAVKAFRLAKVGGDGREYDVEELAGGARCDCADFVFRREGLAGLGCKHIRAAWMMGLIGEYSPAPATPDPRDVYNDAREKLARLADDEAEVRREGEAPAPCCDPADEPAPCTACATEHTPLPVPADEPTADDWQDFGAWASEVDRRAWDARIEADDDASEGWSDDDVITLGPAADPFDDDRPDRRPLAAQIDVEAAHYRTLGTDFGDLIAETLAKLAAECRFLDATTPAGYRDRRDAMLDAVQVEAEARHAARC
jgi:hypothetical protein